MSKRTLIKQFTMNVKDHPWTFRMFTDSAFERLPGTEGGDAVTRPELKIIDFKKSKFNPGVIRHELVHLMVDSSNTSSSDLDTIQMEELCCLIMQFDVFLILTLSERIYTELTKENI